MGYSAFLHCNSLKSITLPKNSQLTSIGGYAFSGCSSLTTIVLPKSVRYIYGEAFANCPELLDVYCYAESVPSTDSDAFDGSYPEYVTLHVPASAINDYKSTVPWSSFSNIVALTDEEMSIDNTEVKNENPAIIYDLHGRRVENPTRGDIYIVNGKKVIK